MAVRLFAGFLATVWLIAVSLSAQQNPNSSSLQPTMAPGTPVCLIYRQTDWWRSGTIPVFATEADAQKWIKATRAGNYNDKTDLVFQGRMSLVKPGVHATVVSFKTGNTPEESICEVETYEDLLKNSDRVWTFAPFIERRKAF